MNPVWIRTLALVCVFGAVVLAAEVLVRAYAARRSETKAIHWRLSAIGAGREGRGQASGLRRDASSVPEGLPPTLDKLAHALERMLFQARVSMAIPRLMLLLIVAPLAIFFSFLLLMAAHWGVGISFGRIVITGTFAFLIGAVLPLFVLNWKAERNRKKIEDQFPVALDVFVRGLRAGHPIAAALDLLTVEMPDPIGSQFGIVVDEVTYGADLRDALQAMADRWGLDDMRMFVVSLSVQNETGGNLAEILENLSQVIRERASMMMKVRALSSEGRMTAIMLTALPVVAFTLLFLGNPRFYLDVADDPAFVPGYVGLLILYTIGFVSIRRMIDLKV